MRKWTWGNLFRCPDISLEMIGLLAIGRDLNREHFKHDELDAIAKAFADSPVEEEEVVKPKPAKPSTLVPNELLEWIEGRLKDWGQSVTANQLLNMRLCQSPRSEPGGGENAGGPAPVKRCCETCEWWEEPFDPGAAMGPDVYGECHKGAPALARTASKWARTKWPETHRSCSCGEWSRKPVSPAEKPSTTTPQPPCPDPRP